MANKFEMYMFDGNSVCFEFNSIVVCNNKIKEDLLDGHIVLEAPKPFIIVTNNEFTDEQVEILEDASFADCMMLYKTKPAFGGIIA